MLTSLNVPFAFGMSFLLAGALFLFIGAALRISNLRQKRQSVEVIAEVREIRKSRSPDGDTSYYPVFRIVSGPFESVEWSSNIGHNPAIHTVEERVSGLYNPRTGVIRSDRMVRLGGALGDASIAFGAGFALIGFYPSWPALMLALLAVSGTGWRLFRAYLQR